MITIDLNCDVGEGILNEAKLFPYLSSCNIACGGHFGNKNTIDNTIERAVENNVKIGAHPSFPDKENFGRKLMDISNQKLKDSLQKQLYLFLERLQKVNQPLHHIKPHGALYNAIAVDKNLAETFLEGIKNIIGNGFLFVPFQSEIEKLALANNINIKYEVFADRNYTADGALVKRAFKNAVIHQPEKITAHIIFMTQHQKVKTIEDVLLPIKADTFCIHGDNENALSILKYLHQHLINKGVAIY